MHRLYLVGSAAIGCWIAGCASISNLDSVLKPPADAATSAAAIAAQSEQDILKLYALGSATYDGTVALASLVCTPASGPDVANSNLTTFANSLTTIDKVAAKPADASYSAILGKIHDDDKAANTDPDAERKGAVKKRDAGRARCAALFADDTAPTTVVSSPKAGGGANLIAPALATFALLDKLVNSILSGIEQAKRDEAIKVTVKELAPQMQGAVDSLRSPRNDGFGVQIVYATPGSAAETMDRTAFGATISIQRWWTAQVIKAHWDELASCRARADSKCLNNARAQNAANDLSVAVLQYRSLALIDTDMIIVSLDKGVKGAQDAVNKKSLSGIFDSLSQIGGALSTISSNYSAFTKSL